MIFGLDIETAQLEYGSPSAWAESPVVAVGISGPDGRGAFLTVNHREERMPRAALANALHRIIGNGTVIGHNLTFDLTHLYSYCGWYPSGPVYCTKILSWLQDENESHRLAACATRLLGSETKDDTIKVWKTFKKKPAEKREISLQSFYSNPAYTWDSVDPEDLQAYCMNDAALTRALFLTPELQQVLEEYPVAVGVENRLIKVITQMQSRGIAVDFYGLVRLGEKVSSEVFSLRNQIYAEAGHPFDIESNDQLGEVLFSELGLPIFGRTASGDASVDKRSLGALDHPLADAVLEYRKLRKLYSTYIVTLAERAKVDGRVRASLNSTGARTGRFSSSNPNLQNIPGGDFRKMFIAPPGKSLIKLDYSQMELRALAYLSNDRAMLEAFGSGTDFHRTTAAMLFGEEQADEKRKIAKAINFGIIFGRHSTSLAREMGVFPMEAEAFMQRYKNLFWEAAKWSEEVANEAAITGFVSTLLGRRRRLLGIHSAAHPVREKARRQAVNTIVQGSSADVTKLAMLSVYDYVSGIPGVELLLCVHDELVLEAPTHIAPLLAPIVAERMCNAAPSLGLFPVDYQVGPSWGGEDYVEEEFILEEGEDDGA
jgi:DNA polymerase-1